MLEKFKPPSTDELPPLPFLPASLFQDQVDLLGQQIRRLEGLLGRHLLDDPELQRLLWIPGIGRIVALTLWLEIDGIDRFPSVRHFHSYARLVPGADNSGGRTRHRASRVRWASTTIFIGPPGCPRRSSSLRKSLNARMLLQQQL